jgi:signal transduction histidine kinase
MDGMDTVFGDLVRVGLGEPKLEVLQKLLVQLAKALGGFGATLWQLRSADGRTAGASLLAASREKPESGHLFVLSHGFEDASYRCAYHDLPLRMATGQAVLHGVCEVPDARSSELVDHDSAFARRANPGSILAVRTTFPDGSSGALTLYRHEEGAFAETTKASLLFLAGHVGALYFAVRDRVAYQLVNDVTSIVIDTAADRTAVNLELKKVCHLISQSFGCLETTIFLEDRLVRPGEWVLSATTCEEVLRTHSYVADEDGPTAWVIRNRRPLFVLNMSAPPDSVVRETKWTPRPGLLKVLRKLYGMEENESGLLKVLRKLSGMEETELDPIPPNCYAAVPLMADERVVGVLRCAACANAPYFIAEREIQLLQILAGRVASFWSRWMKLREVHQRGETWRQFVADMSSLKTFSEALAPRTKTRRLKEDAQKQFYRAALQAIRKSNPDDVDAIEFAMADPTGKVISPVAWWGKEWDRAMAGKDERFRLSLLRPANNAWAHVYHSKEIEFVEDTRDPQIPYASLIPETQQALFVPVMADGQAIGVVGIRTWGWFRDRDQAKLMAQVVAMVMALYHQLTELLSGQARVYQDLEHQLRGPIAQAYKRIRVVMEDDRYSPLPESSDRQVDLNAAGGLLGKVRRVLGNIRLYEELANGHQIVPRKNGCPIRELKKMLVEAAVDNRVVWQHKNINVKVDSTSFDPIRQLVPLDAALFEQVANNLIDNAGKYAQPSSLIVIDGCIDENRHLRITVKNKAAVPILREDVPKIGSIRGYRSEAAQRLTAEGIGSGLYLVRLIVEAHGGSLIISETDPFGDTRIAVTFPLS